MNQWFIDEMARGGVRVGDTWESIAQVIFHQHSYSL